MESEIETINISSENDESLKVIRRLSKRRSSVFRPQEERKCLDYEFPTDYKERLEKEQKEWLDAFELAHKEYKAAKNWRKQHPYIEADKTVLDKSQRDFLEKGPTCDDYLRAVQNFSNKLQLNSCIHSVAVRRNTTDKQHLLSKKHYVEDVCLDSFRKQN